MASDVISEKDLEGIIRDESLVSADSPLQLIEPSASMDNIGNITAALMVNPNAERAQDDSLESLEVYRRTSNKNPPQCDPKTNIYPCGSLEFIGCSGSKKYYAESIIRVS